MWPSDRRRRLAGCLYLVLAGIAPCGNAAVADTAPVADLAHPAKATVIRDPALPQDGMGRMEYTLGQSIFERIWVSAPSSTEAADGLGPLFNARSCVACHPGGARPTSLTDGGGTVPSLVMRLGDVDGRPDPTYGRQVQTESVAGVVSEGRLRIRFETEPLTLADGTVVTLRKPVVDIEQPGYGPLPTTTHRGLRMGPAIHGIGALNAIPTDEIVAGADVEDGDGDGISGRPAWLDATQTSLGRFGWKAAQPDLAAQNAHALMADLGLASALFPDANGECTPAQDACRAAPSGASPQYDNVEVSALLMGVLDRFVAEAVLPSQGPSPPADPQTLEQGRALFERAGCPACHRQSFRAMWPPASAGSRRISPYTDLLLHDMGEGLAEDLREGAANGNEWRTAPLWGLRWAVNLRGEGALLHDGRARTILEAILWHGGEAEAARDFVAGLAAAERAALISFLSSL